MRGLFLAANGIMLLGAVSMANAAVVDSVTFTNVGSGLLGNNIVTYNAAATYTLGNIDWDGFATPINAGTYGSELRVEIDYNLGGAVPVQLGSGTTYPGGSPFTGSSGALTGTNVTAGGTFTFSFYESYDDGGDGLDDAQWDTITFDFNDFTATAPTVLDTFVVGQGLTTLDTNGSAADTELFLYDADGNWLAENDDNGAGGLWSQIDYDLVAGETYYLAVAGYNSSGGPGGWAVTGGSATGDIDLNIDGGLVAENTLASGDVLWYGIEVEIPAPGALALLGLAGLARRRRR